MIPLCVSPEQAAGLFVVGLACIGAISVSALAVGGILVCTVTIPDLLK